MTTLLKLTTSLFSGKGQSSLLVEGLVSDWQAQNPHGRVIARDLGSDPIPHLTGDGFLGFRAAPEARTPAQQAVVAYSDELINELKSADILVLGLPMYNFGVSSSLKCYFDHIARAGVTFRYTEKAPSAYCLARRPALPQRVAGATPELPKTVRPPTYVNSLNLIGITDVEFVYAEGLGVSETVKAESLANARKKLARIATNLTIH